MVCSLFLWKRHDIHNAIFNYIIGSLVLDIIYVVFIKIWRRASEDSHSLSVQLIKNFDGRTGRYSIILNSFADVVDITTTKKVTL